MSAFGAEMLRLKLAPALAGGLADAVVGADKWVEATKRQRARVLQLLLGRLMPARLSDGDLEALIGEIDAGSAEDRKRLRDGICRQIILLGAYCSLQIIGQMPGGAEVVDEVRKRLAEEAA